MDETTSAVPPAEAIVPPAKLGGTIKLTVVFFAPVFALALVVTAVVLSQTTRHELRDYRHAERTAVDTLGAKLNVDVAHVFAELSIFVNQRSMKGLWDDNGQPVPGMLTTLAEDWLHVSRFRRLYDQIRLLDESGQELVRVDFKAGNPLQVARSKLQNKSGRYYFEEAYRLSRGQVFVSPFDLNVEHGNIEQPLKPMIRFATPVFDPRGRKRGIILLNYFGNQILDQLPQQADKSNGGRIALLDSDSYWLRGPRSQDEWGFMYKDRKDRTFANAHPNAWRTLGGQDSSQVETAHGLFTSHAIRPLTQQPGVGAHHNGQLTLAGGNLDARTYGWTLVSFTPSAAYYATRDSRRKLAALILALLGVIFWLGAWRAAKSIALHRHVEANRERMIAEAIAQVKTLRGIIPICSHCKKVRDDAGYWHQVETFVRDHSEADFSHSLCVPCVKDLYPDDADEILDGMDEEHS